MENEIKVGEFIRTKDGRIYQVDSSKDEWALSDIFYKVIVKHSPNIIDLIEEGDYVNGYKVIDIIKTEKKHILYCEGDYVDGGIQKNQIETVVTKEMMKSISYTVTKM